MLVDGAGQRFRPELVDLLEHLPGAEAVQREEGDREHEDDDEDAAPERLLERVRGDDERASHPSATASRYASSSVVSTTRTP